MRFHSSWCHRRVVHYYCHPRARHNTPTVPVDRVRDAVDRVLDLGLGPNDAPIDGVTLVDY